MVESCQSADFYVDDLGGEKVKIEKWLHFVDSYRHLLIELPQEMIDTILVAQGQVKDGFLAYGQQ
ncbi:MAG: hypothetical protein H8E79_06710 [Desulfobulbaceae bacterium]|uniref:Uncharacterized protein n=1 Tax=Candidatus Desulfatifera sulfidica TaxID=2841691 RepID=A0A8J6NAL1_9BACT|nr:hypothetical protein [Candidatus Desulfatifera sulfidica]